MGTGRRAWVDLKSYPGSVLVLNLKAKKAKSSYDLFFEPNRSVRAINMSKLRILTDLYHIVFFMIGHCNALTNTTSKKPTGSEHDGSYK